MPDLPKPRHAGPDPVPRLYREAPAVPDSGQGEGYPAEARGPGPAIALLRTGLGHRPVMGEEVAGPRQPAASDASTTRRRGYGPGFQCRTRTRQPIPLGAGDGFWRRPNLPALRWPGVAAEGAKTQRAKDVKPQGREATLAEHKMGHEHK